MTTNTAASMIDFVAGRSYYGRSICDSNCIYTMLVISRTRCTIRVRMQDGKMKTLRPRRYNGVETVQPNGNYSMALTIGADREQPIDVAARSLGAALIAAATR
jgi:hypothetical protein